MEYAFHVHLLRGLLEVSQWNAEHVLTMLLVILTMEVLHSVATVSKTVMLVLGMLKLGELNLIMSSLKHSLIVFFF